MDTNQPDIFDRIMMLPGFNRFNAFYVQNKSVLLYIFFGGLTTVVSVGSFALANSCFHINELIANIISWVFAVTFAYLTNRVWVFHSQAKGNAIVKEAISFFGGRLATLGIEEAMLFVFVTLMQINGLWIKIIAQFVVLVLNYFISKVIVFKSKKA